MEKLKMESINIAQKNIERIGGLFPNVITEMIDKDGKLKRGINFELLKLELANDVVDGEECYDFTWVGKKECIIEGNTPIRKTLRPCVEESKDWANTGNLYIEGDNLDVLKLMQESYLNDIKLIYIDPPYNTGKDFIYRDNFNLNKDEYEEKIEYRDDGGNIQFIQNNSTNPRFHSDWCSMLYPRLKIANSLLSEDGVIFISINDNEVDNLKKICNEIFDEGNFIHCLKWKRKKQPSFLHGHVASVVEYVLIYAKNKSRLEKLSIENRSDGNTRIDNAANATVERKLKKGIRVKLHSDIKLIKAGIYQNKTMSTEFLDNVEIKNGRTINEVTVKAQFRNDQSQIDRFCDEDLIFITINYGLRRDLLQEELLKRKSIVDLLLDWGDNQESDNEIKELFGHNKPFSYPKPVKLIYNICKSQESNDYTVLDFFAGSATTSQAVMQLNADDGGNRKYIMVQLPEDLDEAIKHAEQNEKEVLKSAINICDELEKPHLLTEIGKERIRRAGNKISNEISKNTSQLQSEEKTKLPVDIGFRVFKLDSTNMKDIYYAANEYNQLMIAGLESNIKEDRTDLDLLYGVLLNWGLPLSLSHKIEEIEGVSVHTVDNGSLVACFAEKISESVVREIAKSQPLRVVFRDSSFANSPDKINVEEIFKLHAPNTTVKVI